MKLNPIPSLVALAGLRAVKAVCLESAPNGKLTDLQRQFMSGVQKFILHTDFPIDALPNISAQELTTFFKEVEFKDRVVRAMIIAACVDGEMSPQAVAKVEHYAEALGVDLSPVRTAWKLANHDLMLARMDIVRKSLPGVKVREVTKTEGIFAIVKQFFPLAGIELEAVTKKYKELESYPEGTLGKEFVHYLRRNKFPFPGEKGAGPEIIVLHDCLHILGNYGTSATEEIEISSFQAGCQFEDPIYGLLFGLAQYHLNIQVAPVAPPQAMQANPEKMIAAFARGCQINRDMWRNFKPWENFSKPVEQVRKEIGLT